MTTRRFALLAAVLWICAIGLTVWIANYSGIPGFDESIATRAHTFAVDNSWLVGVAQFFAAMGSGFVLAPLTVGVVVALWLRDQRWWAVWLGAAGIGGIIISQTVKRTVDRQRPVWDNPLHELTSPSFPSGHSMAGIYGYLAFGIVAWFLGNRALGAVLMVFGLLMGPSRVMFGVHWPTDVIGGWLFAGAWLCTVTAVLLWRWGPPPISVERRSDGSTRDESVGDSQEV